MPHVRIAGEETYFVLAGSIRPGASYGEGNCAMSQRALGFNKRAFMGVDIEIG